MHSENRRHDGRGHHSRYHERGHRDSQEGRPRSLTMDETSGLAPVESPASEALIQICEKCGEKLCQTPDDNPSRTMKSRLKEEIRAQGGKGKFHTVLVDCLGVCPEGTIAVGISRTEKPNQFFTYEVKPEEAAKVILGKIKLRNRGVSCPNYVLLQLNKT